MFYTNFALNLTILHCLFFGIWSILYSTFVVDWDIRRIQKIFYVSEAPPPKPFGSWEALPPTPSAGAPPLGPGVQFTTNVEYKIDHIAKIKNRKIVKFKSKFVSEHYASLGTIFFQTILRILNSHISNTKKRKIDF